MARAATKQKVVRPEFLPSAKALRLRRAALGLSQDALAERTQAGKEEGDETTVSQRTVSDVERAYTGVTNLSAGRVFSLIAALEWTPREFTEATGLDIPGTVIDPTMGRMLGNLPRVHLPKNTLPPPEPLGNLVRLPVLAAQGGTLEDQNDRGREGRYEVIPEIALDGHRAEDCAVIEVYGSSMACEDVLLSLPEGTRFVIDTLEEPQDDDIIVCDLFYEDEWFRVLKIYGRRGHIVLHSYNEEYPPIILRDGMELHKVGVYVNRIGPDRATVRRINRQRLKAKR